MTSSRMGRQYIEEARGLMALVSLALERGMWAATVQKSQQCVELFLRGALRLVAVEPARTHDVAPALRPEAIRIPEWLRPSIADVVAGRAGGGVGGAEPPRSRLASSPIPTTPKCGIRQLPC